MTSVAGARRTAHTTQEIETVKIRSTAKLVAATLAPALAAAVLLPGAADAATYLLRPNGTQALQGGWSVTPSSSTADATLAKGVSQPGAPDVNSFLSSGGPGSWVAVSIPAPPAFAADETLKRTSGWAYVSTDSSQPLTLSLWTGNPLMGYTIVGSTPIPAGQPSSWYSVSTQALLTPLQLSQLAIAVQASGSSGTSRVYAAYGEVDTITQPATQPLQPTPLPPLTSESRRVLSDVSIVSSSVTVASNQNDVPLDLSCAASAVGGCHGVVVLRIVHGTAIASASAAAGQPRAVVARCARGCRVLGKQNFNIAAGHRQKVNVHLAHSARHLLHRHKRLTAQAVTITTDRAGNNQITKTNVTLSRASSGANAPQTPGANVSQPTSNSLP
jgi:hypothetical protein